MRYITRGLLIVSVVSGWIVNMRSKQKVNDNELTSLSAWMDVGAEERKQGGRP